MIERVKADAVKWLLHRADHIENVAKGSITFV
jgi:hypothetical protein